MLMQYMRAFQPRDPREQRRKSPPTPCQHISIQIIPDISSDLSNIFQLQLFQIFPSLNQGSKYVASFCLIKFNPGGGSVY